MSEIPKAYEPQAVEAKWYQYWLEHGCFVADPARVGPRRPAYAIVIPPPNVTGVLHLGHVLNNTIQDLLARKARMDGKEVLWLPGTDHAGIATQAVVERALRKQGVMKHRTDLGREQFLEHVWSWREKHGGLIIQQLRRLGASCDWTRERFTMDPDYSRCVQRVFVELYRQGLIYRGQRMVNWDPAARTALSDEEVEMIEQAGHLWHLKYPLLDDTGRPLPDQCVVVATTRPETMLGDEAVAVNPRDERYQALVGRRCLLPLQNKAIPIIADELVDPQFGTGCVKVTPAHDPADYAMAVKHRLPFTVVIGLDGSMTAAAGATYAGLDRAEARKEVVAALEAAQLLLKVEPYTHKVGFSQRSHVPIEPALSEQWFLRYPAIEAATRAVEAGTIRFHPDRWSKTYTHWMSNLRDWCISRQLWWGHRIPVWQKRVQLTPENWTDQLLPWGWDEVVAGRLKPDAPGATAHIRIVRVRDGAVLDPQADPLMPVTETTAGEYDLQVCTDDEPFGRRFETHGFVQDPDVLDTWFSSWLWPFATMGWPEKTPTLGAFYPTTDLVTGPDIIFFWVARMIMAGYEFMGQPPFRNVYFTGIIRDKQGRKMSKSLGNSPEPLDLIGRYGADALRFGTMRSAPLGQDVLFDEKDVELGRNFCNKLWNACRFRQMQGGQVEGEINPALLSSDDRWILARLDQAIREIDDAFAGYRFNEVTQTLYRVFWGEYCDWYIEATKAVFQSTDAARKANTLAVIDFVLSHLLRLFHPFLPFITEELWHDLGYPADLPAEQGGETLMNARWPRPFSDDEKELFGLDDAALRVAEAKYELVGLGRNLRREFNLPANKKLAFVLRPAGALDPAEIEVLRLLLNAESVAVDPQYTPPKGTPVAANALGELYLPLAGVVDVGAEKARLTRELDKVRAEIQKVETKLANPQFTGKVPPQVLQEHQQRLVDWKAREQQLLAALDHLAT